MKRSNFFNIVVKLFQNDSFYDSLSNIVKAPYSQEITHKDFDSGGKAV